MLRTTALFAALGLACSCGGGAGPGPTDEEQGSVFVAFASNFADFHGWQSFDVTKEAAPGTVHPDATLIEYLNRPPPKGSREFPVGTIIVKEPTTGTPNAEPFFAMVKRAEGTTPKGPLVGSGSSC